MLGLGLSIPRCAVRAGDALTREVASILAKYGTDAHVYLPGIGVINGLTAGNYLDSAGTTAATVDNPVGLVLDAANSVLGAEIITVNSAVMTGYNDYTPITGSNVVAGSTYLVSFDYVQSSGNSEAQVGGASVLVLSGAASGTYRGYVKAVSTVAPNYYCNFANGTISNFSVKEVSGIHASQATTANKPILRRGAVNLLLQSQTFTVSPWISFATRTANTTTAPDGTNTGSTITSLGAGSDSVQQNYAGGIAGVTYTFSFYAKKNTSSTIGSETTGVAAKNFIFNFDTLALTGTADNKKAESVGNGWYRLSYSVTATSTTTLSVYIYGGSGYAVAGVSYIWGAQLEVGSTATTYIPTTTAPASSSTGNYWWQFDGSNDSLALGSVPFQMADDFAIIAGASIATLGTNKCIYGQGSAGGAESVPYIGVTSSNLIIMYVFSASGGIIDTSTGGTTIAANTPFVVSARVVGTTCSTRKNGAAYGTNKSKSGTYATAIKAEIGSSGRPTSSEFMNGSIYPVIAIKGTLSDADCLILERFIGTLSGVSI